MKLKNLLQLKEKLQKEKDLGKIYTYYMDEFGDHEEFTDLGEQGENNFLLQVIAQVCQHLFGKAVNVDGILLIYIPEYKFFHAPFFANNHIGGVIYFEDIQTGLLAASSGDGMVKYSRFTGASKTSIFDRN
jgi:hypothetical protein